MIPGDNLLSLPGFTHHRITLKTTAKTTENQEITCYKPTWQLLSLIKAHFKMLKGKNVTQTVSHHNSNILNYVSIYLGCMSKK